MVTAVPNKERLNGHRHRCLPACAVILLGKAMSCQGHIHVFERVGRTSSTYRLNTPRLFCSNPESCAAPLSRIRFCPTRRRHSCDTITATISRSTSRSAQELSDHRLGQPRHATELGSHKTLICYLTPESCQIARPVTKTLGGIARTQQRRIFAVRCACLMSYGHNAIFRVCVMR